MRVDLPVILPHATVERDQCVARLREQVLSQRGILEAHMDNAHDRPTLCLHYDANLVTLDKVVRIVTRTGVAVTKRYAHETLWITGMDAADSAADVEKVISRMAGVLAVSVNYAAERAHLEYDLQKTSRKAILAEIARLGYRVRQEADDHSGHDHGDHGHDGHDHAGGGHSHGSGGLAMPIAS
ncbi:MAG: heavy metal-associated domain-containing protein, partial [Candidatus Thermoplasmatota archaeon]